MSSRLASKMQRELVSKNKINQNVPPVKAKEKLENVDLFKDSLLSTGSLLSCWDTNNPRIA